MAFRTPRVGSWLTGPYSGPMVFAAGLLAAFALGIGWVLQQRVASHAGVSELFSLRLLLHLMRQPVWWAGIGAMIVGQAAGGWALQLGTVSQVEPLLSVNLLVALVTANLLVRQAPRWPEVAGALLMSAALGVFLAVGDPHSGRATRPWHWIAVATVAVAGLVVLLVAEARRRSDLVVEAVLLAIAAGTLYGLADVCTRGVYVQVEDHGFVSLPGSPWPYLMVGAAAAGVWASQGAFRSARLDYSLPPIAAAESIVGVVLGVLVLGDRLSVTVPGLAVEAICVVAMVAGVVLIGRSPALKHVHLRHHRGAGRRPRPPRSGASERV